MHSVPLLPAPHPSKVVVGHVRYVDRPQPVHRDALTKRAQKVHCDEPRRWGAPARIRAKAVLAELDTIAHEEPPGGGDHPGAELQDPDVRPPLLHRVHHFVKGVALGAAHHDGDVLLQGQGHVLVPPRPVVAAPQAIQNPHGCLRAHPPGEGLDGGFVQPDDNVVSVDGLAELGELHVPRTPHNRTRVELVVSGDLLEGVRELGHRVPVQGVVPVQQLLVVALVDESVGHVEAVLPLGEVEVQTAQRGLHDRRGPRASLVTSTAGHPDLLLDALVFVLLAPPFLRRVRLGILARLGLSRLGGSTGTRGCRPTGRTLAARVLLRDVDDVPVHPLLHRGGRGQQHDRCQRAQQQEEEPGEPLGLGFGPLRPPHPARRSSNEVLAPSSSSRRCRETPEPGQRRPTQPRDRMLAHWPAPRQPPSCRFGMMGGEG